MENNFLDFVEETIKLEKTIKKAKEIFNKLNLTITIPTTEYIFLSSYYISSITLAEDMLSLIKNQRQTNLDSYFRIFLERSAEFYQLASKYNNEFELTREKNFLLRIDLWRKWLTLLRISEGNSLNEKDELMKKIIDNIKDTVNVFFPEYVNEIDETSTGNLIKSIQNIIKNMDNDPSKIDKARIELSKSKGGSDFVMEALNSNPIWGENGYPGNEILYGILSESVHSNPLPIVLLSKNGNEFTFNGKSDNLISIENTIRFTIDYMIDLLDRTYLKEGDD